MLHAASVSLGLFLVWLLATQQWAGPANVAAGAGIAVACTLFAARFGGLSPDFARAPMLFWLALSQVAEVARGAGAVLRRALSAKAALNPALVRVRTRAVGASAKAAFANALSAAPGVVAVATEADGLLLHVIDEEAIEPAEFGRLGERVRAAAGGGR